jgi:predicted nucleic acid-binding protein
MCLLSRLRYRTQTPEIQRPRESFINKLLAGPDGVSLHERDGPARRENQWRAAEPGRGDSFGDLLIGATALSLGFEVLTDNLRDFKRIPGLSVVQF